MNAPLWNTEIDAKAKVPKNNSTFKIFWRNNKVQILIECTV